MGFICKKKLFKVVKEVFIYLKIQKKKGLIWIIKEFLVWKKTVFWIWVIVKKMSVLILIKKINVVILIYI